MNPNTNTPKVTPKDFFLHLGAVVALYASVIAFINLSFSVINYYLPDQLAGYFYANSVAWPISMLIILIPILYVLEWLINRDISRNPEKKDLWIRKWKIYLTVFLTIVLVSGDLIALINTYLSGEITARFGYKVLVILLVGGVVGKYYFYSLYTNLKMSKFVTKTNAWVGLILVILAIVVGFMAVGSPSKQRVIRFDNQRINDLQNIQWQIVNYWQQKGSLPVNLEDIEDPLYGSIVPSDPDTETSYGYEVKDTLTFELCADFDLPYEDVSGKGTYYGSSISYRAIDTSYPFMENNGENWTHDVGRTCFERTIDPEKSPRILQKVAE